MRGVLKRAAASAVPALLALAVSPASALAAPHTARAIAGTARGGRQVHERLAQLPVSGTTQGRPVGTTGTTETTADTHPSNGTGAEFAAAPVIVTFPAAFVAIPVYPDSVINGGPARLVHFSRGPSSFRGGGAYGIIAFGKDYKVVGNRVVSSSGSGQSIYLNNGNGTASTNGF
jgi:hypothetical protein